MPLINPANLKSLRSKRNWTLDHLAEASSVNRVTISRIENGHTSDCRKVTLDRLAKALGCDLETLTGADIVEDATERLFGRKTQMNMRVADDARNALALVADRYRVKPSHIVHLAPFLFLWAAEASLKMRREALSEIVGQLEALSALPKPKHLDEEITHHWRADDVLLAEERSIKALDLFGSLVPDEHLSADYEDSEENPFVCFLKSLADDLGELAEFDYWSTGWDQPGYQLGDAEALKMTGGNEEAARQITAGYAPLHEMPKPLADAEPEAIAEWAIKTGEEYRREHFPELESVMINLGLEKGDG